MILKVFAVILFSTKLSFQLSCLDESGKPVDWFIVYKIPKIEKSEDNLLRTGYAYAFIDDKSSNKWTFSSISIKEKDSLFGQIIGSVISCKRDKEVSYIAYSDQPPEAKDSGTSAHAKGLFAFDSNGGFFFSHSVPTFPTLKRAYKYPPNGANNGQTAICISLGSKDTITLNNIATNLLVMKPNIYDIKIGNNLSQKSNLFLDLKNRNWIKDPKHIDSNIVSKKGTTFKAFSKNKDHEGDFYATLIGPHFKKNLLVQSWRSGKGGKLPSNCKDSYQVQNVNRITIENIDWKYTEDHSKWAISQEGTGKSYTCISDINRMESQSKRGGGSLCIDSKQVWNVFKKSIQEIEGCPKKG